MSFLNLHEVEELARATLPAATFEYFAGGACDEVTLAANRRAFEEIALRYRTSPAGSSTNAASVSRNRAPSAPSTTRWSNERLTVILGRTAG